jgi:DNA-binding response OmpR family regulator
MEHHPTILVIDKDKDIRRILRLRFKQSGLSPLLAEGGAEGLAYLRSQRVDLVILEVDLPDISGEDLCTAIREISSEILIIILTAQDSPRTKVQMLSLGADDYVVKPFSPAELEARVQAVLRRGRSQEEQASSNTVAMRFNFPEEVKVACEQYLL